MKQSHYADIDKKWLSEKRYNHPDQEMFRVTYAIVDRAAMVSGAPPLVKVQPWGIGLGPMVVQTHSIYVHFCHSLPWCFSREKWLSEKHYNHPEQEMFRVTYAIVDRAAMASAAPPRVKVQPLGLGKVPWLCKPIQSTCTSALPCNGVFPGKSGCLRRTTITLSRKCSV